MRSSTGPMKTVCGGGNVDVDLNDDLLDVNLSVDWVLLFNFHIK